MRFGLPGVSMWSSVEDEFANILSTRVFHTLADDFGYVEIFRKAGS